MVAYSVPDQSIGVSPRSIIHFQQSNTVRTEQRARLCAETMERPALSMETVKR